MALAEQELANEHFAPNKIPAMDTFEQIAVALIQPSPLNPRDLFEQTALVDLSESIREHGVLEPLIVRLHVQDAEHGGTGYQIIAGERRFRASQMAGLTHVPCIVKDITSDRDALVLTLTENLLRQDINPLEKAQGFKQLAGLGWSQERIAQQFRSTQAVVSNTMRLLRLPDLVQEMIRAGRLTASHGVLLLPVLDAGGQIHATRETQMEGVTTLAQEAAEGEWPVKRLAETIALRFPRMDAATEAALLDVPQSQGAKTLPPDPVPNPEPVTALSTQGDMTDAEWEASVRPQGETSPQGETDESLQHRPVAAPEDAPGTETDSTDELQATANTEETDVTHEPTQAVDGNGSAASSAPSQLPEDAPAPSAPKTSAPVPPVAKAPAPIAPKAEAPPTPTLPPGFTTALIKVDDYNAAVEMGLWPLSQGIARVREMEAAETPQGDTPSAAPVSPALALAVGVASRLAEMNSTGGTVFSQEETQTLDEMFPARESTGAEHIIAVLVSRRLRFLNSGQPASIPAPTGDNQ